MVYLWIAYVRFLRLRPTRRLVDRLARDPERTYSRPQVKVWDATDRLLRLAGLEPASQVTLGTSHPRLRNVRSVGITISSNPGGTYANNRFI